MLLAVGLGIPAAYFLSYFLSVRQRSKALKGGKVAYTLTLSDEGVQVTKGKQRVHFVWDKVTAVYRLPRSICLYTGPHNAFLLPSDQEDEASSRAWVLMAEHLDPQWVKDRT